MNDKWIELGKCHRPHGIKGEFEFSLDSGEDSILDKGDEILLIPLSNKSQLPSEGRLYEITVLRFGNKIIARLKGVEDRTTVEEMVPFSIQVQRSRFPETEDGEFYVDDLMGLEVREHPGGEKIGVIRGHYYNGAQLVFEIKGTKNFDLPFVEHFFPVVDTEAGFIEVIIPEYVD
jgi:16S rRNA processing protein RimM